MKKIIISTLTLLFACAATAQLTAFDPTKGFNARLERELGAITSIESDFRQEKFMDILSEKVVSNGKFYYRAEQKIAMLYTKPLAYSIVINGEKLMTESHGKRNTVALKSNAVFKEVQTLLSACMTGKLNTLQGHYKIGYFEDKNNYVVHVDPLNASVKAYIARMVITLSKKDMAVVSLRINENGKNYTEYQFTNRKYNTLTNDEKFSLR